MNLKEQILNWDRKSAEDIVKIYFRNFENESFPSELISLLAEKEPEVGATWLLKKHLEEGNTIDIKTISTVYRQTTKLSEWGAKLHILQCMPFILIPEIEKETVENFLRNCLADKNKFVRAWAYGGFYLLADQHPEYREEATQFIDDAMLNESASIKARIRNSIKVGFLSD